MVIGRRAADGDTSGDDCDHRHDSYQHRAGATRQALAILSRLVVVVIVIVIVIVLMIVVVMTVWDGVGRITVCD